jgi:predicted ribosome quality control (RQC) complex YloA/Tae2 family protein
METVTKETLKVQNKRVRRMKTPVRDMENPIRSQVSENEEVSDRDRLRTAAHLLLGHLEIAIRQHQARTQKSADAREKKMKILFGEKNTCMENLTELTNLMLKIEKPLAQETTTVTNTETLTMTENDMALLNGFVSRIRGGNSAE